MKKGITGEDILDYNLQFLVTSDPFVHRILLRLEKVPTKNIDTMGVHVEKDSNKIILAYNPDFVKELSKLNDAYVRYVLTHETYHVVLGHCTHRKSTDETRKRKHNIAGDLAINSILTDSTYRKMPEGKYKGIRPSDYHLDEVDYNGNKKPFPDNMPLEYYFKLLKDDQFPQLQIGYGDGDGGSFDTHDSWDECPAAQAEIRSLVQRLMKDEAVWGKVPSNCQAIIRAAQRSKVQWQNQLRQYIGMLVSARNTPYLKTFDRRYGWPFPGMRPQYTDRILVSVDTSASVDDTQLSQILAEVNAIREHYAVDLIMHDAALSYGPKPFDQKAVKFEMHGRGGTSFKPTMEVAKKGRYNALIMLTDGHGDAVDYPEGVREVIWVLIDSKYCSVPWGKKITIPSDTHYDLEDDSRSPFPFPTSRRSLFPTTK